MRYDAVPRVVEVTAEAGGVGYGVVLVATRREARSHAERNVPGQTGEGDNGAGQVDHRCPPLARSTVALAASSVALTPKSLPNPSRAL